MINPYESNDVEKVVELSKYPGRQEEGTWTTMTLGEYYQKRNSLPVVVPTLDPNNKKPLLQFGLGNYALRRAKQYIVMAKMRTLQSRLANYKSYQEYVTDCYKAPLDLEIKVRHFTEPVCKYIKINFVLVII